MVDFGPDSSSVSGRKSAWIRDLGRLNLARVGWAAFCFFLHRWLPLFPEEDDDRWA